MGLIERSIIRRRVRRMSFEQIYTEIKDVDVNSYYYKRLIKRYNKLVRKAYKVFE